jgi:hypothetical protein
MQGYLLRLSVVSFAGLLFLFVLQPTAANGATITVTGTGDTVAVDGAITLREAITSINQGSNISDVVAVGAYGTNDTINFNIVGVGVKTINLGSPLPAIIKPLTINGYTQGFATANTLANADNAVILVELNGTGAGANVNGLTLGVGSSGSTIRGLTINLFAGNGIVVQSNGNTIIGNFVGVDPTGTTQRPNGTFPNSGDGIRVENASNNHIGGSNPADRNVASGNAIDGIHIVGSLTAPATGNLVQGNFVGVAADGKSSLGIRTESAPAVGTAEGNNLFGIEVSGGDNNTIGGTIAGARNVVGLNGAGIVIDNGGQGNFIQGNFSGIGADGATPVGNLLQGIVLRSSNSFSAPLGPAQPNEPGVSFNLIGGTVAGAGNLVEFNGTAGISVFGNPLSASAQPNVGNEIVGNSIFLNGRSNPTALLGIDLTNGFTFPKDDGLTPNDSKGHGAPNDPNNFQNFPVLTSALPNSGKTDVSGTLKADANSTYRIEFFASDTDPSGGVPEGQQFLGSVNISTDANGSGAFSVTLNVPVANGRIVTANATDAVGNTSEFSAGLVIPTPLPTLSINDVSITEGDSGTKALNFNVALSAATSATVKVDFATANGTATAGSDYVATSGTLTFNPGDLAKPVSVTINGDQTFEPDETFTVNLTNPVNATVSKAQGTGTIQNDDAQGGNISFSQSSYSVNENAGSLIITVNRSGDTSGPATVDYATSDDSNPASPVSCAPPSGGIASSRCDFTTSIGTLRFAANDKSKSFVVLINQDSYVEGPEAFTVTLSNLTGGSVFAAPSTATVTINDMQPVSQSNVIDFADFFVVQHYRDFLNREADPSGLDFWTKQITSCGNDASCTDARRVNVSAAFYLSIEFQETGGFAIRVQRSAFGKKSQDSTRVTFAQFISSAQFVGNGVVVGQPGADATLSANKDAFATQIVTSTAFTNAYAPGLTADQFVTALFNSAGVTPTTADKNAAVTAFGGGGTAGRAAALRSVSDSTSVRNADFSPTFVLMEYFGYLRRNPDTAGYDFWLAKLKNFGGDFIKAEMVKAFISSNEYRQRFGSQ